MVGMEELSAMRREAGMDLKLVIQMFMLGNIDSFAPESRMPVEGWQDKTS